MHSASCFRVNPGYEDPFLDAHRQTAGVWPGMRHVNLIKTGEGRYCIIAERDSMDALAAARPRMIETLNRFRRTLEDLGGGLPVEARPATPSRAGQSGPTYANASSNR